MIQYDIPILLIAFNRPDYFEKVLDAVKQVQPSKLFIACDGPRNNNAQDEVKCNQVREIANTVNWPCDVKRLYREKNVGCGLGPSEAISWAFSFVDKLIILEDDCVPVASFFSFCRDMLYRYEEDKRIWLVSGDCYCPIEGCFDESDYIFSNYGHTHGWATWKRCWDKFDIRMSDFESFLNKGGAYNILPTKKAAHVYNQKYLKVYRRIDDEIKHSWDSQWGYVRLKNAGLAIIPSKHLIQNIGVSGTHFSEECSVNRVVAENLPELLRHPAEVKINVHHDAEYFNRYILPMYPGIVQRVFKRLKKILRKK